MANIPVLKRPKPNDSEEELLRMQEEFLRTHQNPSAKVINLRNEANDKNKLHCTSNVKHDLNKNSPRSIFSESKRLKSQVGYSTSQASGDVSNLSLDKEAYQGLGINMSDADADNINTIPLASSNLILHDIVEKKYDMDKYEFSKQKVTSIASTTGFPQVFVFDRLVSKNSSNQSLFLQHISKNQYGIDTSEPSSTISLKKEERDNVAEASWTNEIHMENLEKLKEMSHEQILKEQKELRTILQPDVIEFLKNRKKKIETKIIISEGGCEEVDVSEKKQAKVDMEQKNQNKKVSLNDNNAQPMEIEDPISTLPQQSVDIIMQAKEKGWVHMDRIETEKLKWMEDLPIEHDEPRPDGPYNARFDFNGVLLPFKDESLTVDKGLHHHGEEPDRPGYSLQELLQLSRSSSQQQRCTALTTLANIMEKSRNSLYDKALQPAPLRALSERNILLLLRFSLDDTSVNVLTASLQALRAFLYSEAEEICLDRLYGYDDYIEPILEPKLNDVGDVSSLKDHELAQIDAIAALMRSDILLRITYILYEVHPPPIGVTHALEILIRLARHSRITAINVASTPYLLDTIVQNFIPLSADRMAMPSEINNVYGVPLTSAIKLCRVLVCYGGKPVAQRLDRLKIVQPLLFYINSDVGKGSLNLCIESLRLWRILLMHEVAMDSIEGAQMTIISQLQILLSSHDIQNTSEVACEYAACLIALAGTSKLLRSNILVLLQKWSVQLRSINTLTWGIGKLVAETLIAAQDPSTIDAVQMSKTQAFGSLRTTSNLLSDLVPAVEREPECLPHLGVLTQDGHLQPVVSHRSVFPFLAIALKALVHGCFITEIEAIFNLPEVKRYLKELEGTQWCLERSWYTRTELSFLTCMVEAAFIPSINLDDGTKHCAWKIAIKLVSSLSADKTQNVKSMLRIVLSRTSLMTVTNAMSKLRTTEYVADTKDGSKDDAASMYEDYLSGGQDWRQAAMPIDWLYLPLVQLYIRCKNGGICHEKDKNDIRILLNVELFLPDLIEKLSPSLRFSRLVLGYLCDTIYLNNDVSALLSEAMSNILRKHYRRLDFTSAMPGLSSFTDLFTAMCEHFCSTSYGDNGFAMALLAPLAQRHDVHYRKLLWSEHASLLRYLRLPLEDLLIPVEEYLYPVENDASLIESYITALVRDTISPVWCPIPYTVALHHSAMYLKRSTKLAVTMRKRIGKIENAKLANALLCYEPPTAGR
ncbi:hypothetical protein KM043_001468 [Ampulex compressa]|nr:hypothetical protein KM043_001468 [Ampulex compressa]